MEKEILYKVFYIHQGKYFLTHSWLTDNPKTSITKKHPDFNKEVGWFTFEQATKFIKNSSVGTIWGICDANGKQWVAGKFDKVLKL